MKSSLKHQAGYTILSVLIFLLIFLLLFILFIPAAAQEGDDQEKLEFGARLYAENCALCHGEDGEGRVGATLAKDWPSIRPDLRVRETIINGVPGTLMPAWSSAMGGPLNEEEIDALVFYILSWQSGGPPYIFSTPGPRLALTPPPGVVGDPNNGANLFNANCAVCHGLQGEGRVGATLAKDWSSFRPDLRVKSVIVSGVEGSVMPAWSQEHGGPFSEQMIDNIVAYILTWSSAPYPAPSPVETPESTQGPLTGWPVWVIFILLFIILIVAIVYFSRRDQVED